ncbi:hypothetical protein [Novosphingobium sp. PhB165]|uniref:hypothetical protein n=1 Tax=Novosphingobium sp. PhB165 TaxID=2485105 RepID=UPI0014050A76|nr:hypothetical protein [Novosphingobium sp. PhB165]
MENSANIRGPISSPEIEAFAIGFDDGPIQGPSHIAWLLESTALQSGWPLNKSLGSETDLLERFKASRDAVRGAIRIVEARGSMRMRRGCRGGLQLQTPRVETASVALAIYLRTHGYAPQEMEAAAATLAPLLPRSAAGEAIRALIKHAAAMMSDDMSIVAGSDNRAESFAMEIIVNAGSPLPAEGVRIGNEAKLCGETGLGHRTFRQALNILEDLDMLQVSRGRGGGYILKPASFMGVVRRIFVLLASRQTSPGQVREALFAIRAGILRLALTKLRTAPAQRREQWCISTLDMMLPLSEPRRWVALQHAIDELAGDRLTKTLASAIVAYTARTAPPLECHEPIDLGLAAAERGVVSAIAADLPAQAEHHLHAGQGLLTSLNRQHEKPIFCTHTPCS